MYYNKNVMGAWLSSIFTWLSIETLEGVFKFVAAGAAAIAAIIYIFKIYYDFKKSKLDYQKEKEQN